MSGMLPISATDGEIMAEIGRRLGALRRSRRLSQSDAAELSGVSRRTIYSAEHGENPNLLTIVRLLRTYGALDALSGFIPETEISPMEIVSGKGKGPRRRG